MFVEREDGRNLHHPGDTQCSVWDLGENRECVPSGERGKKLDFWGFQMRSLSPVTRDILRKGLKEVPSLGSFKGLF